MLEHPVQRQPIVAVGPHGHDPQVLGGGEPEDRRAGFARTKILDIDDGLRRRGSEGEELAIRRMTVYLPDKPWLPANWLPTDQHRAVSATDETRMKHG